MSNLPKMSLFLLAAGAQGENLLECLTRLDSEWIELDVEGGYKLTSKDTCSIMGPNDCARPGVAQCCHYHCETNNMCDKSGPKPAEDVKSCLIKFNTRTWWDPRILSDAVVTPSSCDAVDPNDPRAAFCCPSAARRRLEADEEVTEEESTADDVEAEEGNKAEEEGSEAEPTATVVDIEEMCSLFVQGSESTDDPKPEEADKEDGEEDSDDTEDGSTDEEEEGDDTEEDGVVEKGSTDGVEDESEDTESEVTEGDDTEEGNEGANDKTKEGEPAAGKKPKSGASAFGFTALALVLATA